MLTVGSLFAGIGGFDLGFERAGFEIKWQVEIDPFCRAVLAKHWPDVRRYEDVRECCGSLLRAERLIIAGHENGRCAECGRRDWLPWVDVLCGGFPCQDVSESGKRVGIDGPRSGLWREMGRLVSELRPRYVVVENVSGLLLGGIGRVVGDLALLGYDAEWTTLSACRFGAPHTRERVFIVAYPHRDDGGTSRTDQAEAAESRSSLGGDRAHRRLSAWFSTEPTLDRMVHGFPGLVDQIRPYGNAILPQEAQWVAERINEAEAAKE